MAKFSTFVLFLFLAIVAAGLFGAVHDQISCTVSPEYFNRFKFPMFHLLDTHTPERIRAAEVGVLASWWMGIPLGLLSGVAGFIHKDPVQMNSALLKSIPVIVGFTLAFALAGLVYGYLQTQTVDIAAYDGWYIPPGLTNIRRFLCAGYMHNSAYLGGVVAIPVAWAYHFSIKWRAKNAT
jgi:hypothetical protein